MLTRRHLIKSLCLTPFIPVGLYFAAKKGKEMGRGDLAAQIEAQPERSDYAKFVGSYRDLYLKRQQEAFERLVAQAEYWTWNPTRA